MANLAILGGPKSVPSLTPYSSLGEEETQAVLRVMKGGCLSRFLGAWGDDFMGGEEILKLEAAWSKKFASSFAVSVNSATSGLYVAVGAVGVGPGDEVIVPPYTMSATAMAPLVYGGIPVFADIEEETFCIDPREVEKKISPRTKAIIAVNLFGHPAKLTELRALADKHGIKLIEDNAQGPLATENGKYAGTIGHIGVFSLNYHKHIHSGEGGICTTDDKELALKMQMIRNHAENAVEPAGVQDMTNLVGYNYRLSELAAAIASEQLAKGDKLVAEREKIATTLTRELSALPGLTPPAVRDNCRHVYYTWCAKYDANVVGVSRKVFADALKAEGVPVFEGYVKPLYWLPIFQKRIALGNQGFPFNLSKVTYEKGLCPVVERMHERELLGFGVCSYALPDNELTQVIAAIKKVYESRHQLAALSEERASDLVAR